MFGLAFRGNIGSGVDPFECRAMIVQVFSLINYFLHFDHGWSIPWDFQHSVSLRNESSTNVPHIQSLYIRIKENTRTWIQYNTCKTIKNNINNWQHGVLQNYSQHSKYLMDIEMFNGLSMIKATLFNIMIEKCCCWCRYPCTQWPIITTSLHSQIINLYD